MAERIECAKSCQFFGFNGLTHWCRHPDVNCKIKDFTKKCKRWWDRYKKEEPPVLRISIEDLPKEVAE